MNERTYSKIVKRALDSLPEPALVVALDQLRFVRGDDDRLTLINEAWLLVASGRDTADAVRFLRSSRKRERKDMRSAGSALDVTIDGGEASLVQNDPAAGMLAVEEYLDAALAAGWSVAAAPATVGQEPALPVALAARACRRGLRTVQTRMRGVCRAELRGQGVIPGVPAACEVYATRAPRVHRG